MSTKITILVSALLLALNLSAAVERHALVIGNANYQSSPLRNPLNDARDMAAALKGLGFQVQSLLDADAGQMEQAILDFGDRLRTGGVGLFYYAGHGVQAQGSNYLIPLQANISREIQLKRKAIDAGLVLDAMGAANNGLNIVILDACRDNPYANSFRNTTRGLARMDSPKGSLIAYATAPGDVAADGDGRNGVFTKHLLEQMQKPGVQVEQVFKQVTQAVHAETRQRQTPFMTSSLLGDFYFKPASATASTTAPVPKPAPAPAPTTQTTPSTIDGLSLADWLLVYGDNAITTANLDKIIAYERQHGGNAASRSYINKGLKVALANVNSADDLLEYQGKFGYLPGAPAQIEARLAELLAAGASRQDLIRLRGQFPASATLRLQLAGEYHRAQLFDAAAGEYQSWLGLTDSSHPERKQVLKALVAAREGRLPEAQSLAFRNYRVTPEKVELRVVKAKQGAGDKACKHFFGSNASIVDWFDLKVRYGEIKSAGQLDEFFQSLMIVAHPVPKSLKEEGWVRGYAISADGDEVAGNTSYNGPKEGRQFFFDLMEGNVPSNYLVHDDIDRNKIVLGSWPTRKQVLCVIR